jgi:hypothetical protein
LDNPAPVSAPTDGDRGLQLNIILAQGGRTFLRQIGELTDVERIDLLDRILRRVCSPPIKWSLTPYSDDPQQADEALFFPVKEVR